MSEEWDSQTVIGFKRQTAKVAKSSDLNGMSLVNSICYLLRNGANSYNITAVSQLPPRLS